MDGNGKEWESLGTGMAYISWQLVQVGVLTTKVITTEKVVLMDMNMMNTISSLKELGIFMVRRRCFCFSAVCVCARARMILYKYVVLLSYS